MGSSELPPTPLKQRAMERCFGGWGGEMLCQRGKWAPGNPQMGNVDDA